MAAGRGIENLTAGQTRDTNTEGIDSIFNQQRYPGLWSWYRGLEDYVKSLPAVETILSNPERLLEGIGGSQKLEARTTLLHTPVPFSLD